MDFNEMAVKLIEDDPELKKDIKDKIREAIKGMDITQQVHEGVEGALEYFFEDFTLGGIEKPIQSFIIKALKGKLDKED